MIHFFNLIPHKQFKEIGDQKFPLTVKDIWDLFEPAPNKSDSLFGEITNIGMNNEISIENLALLIAELMDVELNIISTEERTRPNNSEVEQLRCDNSKLLEHTSWKPDYTLEQGLTEVIKWTKDLENSSFYKVDIYNV